MLSKSNEFVSVFLSDTCLKIVRSHGNGMSAKVSHALSKDISGVGSAQLSSVIHSALSGINTKNSNLLFILPQSMVTTKNIEIPSVNSGEINSIVNLQASRHTPFSRDEIQMGYINIGVHKKNYTKVLLAIANKNTLKERLITLQAAGLKFKNVFFSPEGVGPFYSSILKLKGKSAPVGIVDVDEDSTNFIVIYRGTAITTRNIPVGRAHLQGQGAAAHEQLVDELKNSLDSYIAEDIESAPANFVLTLDNEETKSLQMNLQQRLNWDVQIVPYINHVKIDKNVLNQITTGSQRVSFLDVIASAAFARTAKINMVPEEFQLQKSIEEQGREVLKAAIFGFLLLILVGGLFGLKIYFKNTYLKNMMSSYEQKRKEVVLLEDRSAKTKILRDFLSSRMVGLDTIKGLYQNIPNEIYLTGVEMDEEGNVRIQGISDVASIVFNLGTSLKESEFFKSVDIKSTTAKKDRGKDVSAFEITLQIRSKDEPPGAKPLKE